MISGQENYCSYIVTKNFPPSENKILVKQSPMLVVDNSDVTLSCRYSHNLLLKEFRASLYKGVNSDVEVCVANGNLSSQLQFHSNVGFTCDGNLNNETVTFYLRNLHVNQTDIYFCRVEVMYPPPYLDNEKSNGTIIHVKGNCTCVWQCWTQGWGKWWGWNTHQWSEFKDK